MRLFQWLFIAAWLCVATAVSATDDSEAAQNVIRETTDRMLVELNQQKGMLRSDPTKVYALINEIVIGKFDFFRMSKLVLGKHWRTASDEQRQRFTHAFRERLVPTYAKALIKVAGEEVGVEYLPVRAESNPRFITVKTKVTFQGKKAAVDYAMYKDQQGSWKVYNVLAEGISLVTNYRTEFDNDIRTLGGIDGLIEKIEASNKAHAEAELNGASS